jgi:hypothetical protein
MKRWPGILLLFFAALLVGCGGSHDARITAELDRADSLLRTSDTAAHSAALRQMLALDTAHALQADEALRARHALLLVQARYKCYMTEPADSALIDSALSYYADHHGSSADHERYTRALIYSGAVAEELGHPQQAMQYYLQAEEAADPKDHFNIGYVNLRIGEFYESEYVTDSTDRVRIKQALLHFKAADDIYYQAVCLTSVGGLYRTHNNDSALNYLQQAISLSREHGLTYNYYKALDKLCGLYYFMDDYGRSKNVAMKIYYENQGVYDDTQYLSFGVRSFAKLGMADSAEYFLNQLPTPQSQMDSVTWFNVNAEISRAKGDFRNYSTFAIKSDSIAEMAILNSYQVQLKDAEEKYNNSILQLKNSRLRFNQFLFIFISLLLLLLLLLLLQRYHIIKRQIKMANSEKSLIESEMQRIALEQEVAEMRLGQLETEKGQLEKKNEQLTSDNKQLTTDKERLEIEKEQAKIEKERALSEISLNTGNNNENIDTPELLACHHAVLRELSEKLQCDDENVSFLSAIFTKRKRFNLTIGELSKDFWINVEKVANLGFNGIISYVRKNYPETSEDEIRFIGLSCLKLSNEVIKVCLDLSNIKTVSSYKTYIVNRVTGKTQNIDDFINGFLQNREVFYND